MMSWNINDIAEKSWVQHLLFWTLSLLILTGAFATAWPVSKADFIYTVLFHISLITAVYIHLLLLLPLIVDKRQPVLYGLGLIILMIGSVLLNEYTFTHLSDWIFPGFYFVSYYSWGQIALFIGLFLVLTTALKFSKSWLDLQRTRLELEASRRANIETELMALRAQVNPHFLFNSLHSIYALALEQSKRTPEMILQLSNVLRFMLYEADKEFINLEQEIACINEFVALQRVRLHEDAQVTFETDNRCPNARITPLLLMPLVDNCFKHGLIGRHTKIGLKLSCTDGILNFESTNTLGRADQTDHFDRPGGIGLDNVRRRLELAYPGRHTLSIDQSENAYHVILKVDLS